MKTGMGLLILLCVFLSMPGFARDSNTCSPTGVWYGGSDYKYMLTITPLTEDTFAIQYEAVFANSSFGYNAWTSWQEQLKQQKDGHYTAQAISLYTTSSELPPPENSYELDAIREKVEFTDCDNLKATIYFFGAYLDLVKLPFVDAPDFGYLSPGETIIETYHRVPTKCMVCDSFSVPSLRMRNKH
jgi:hypothetical protein